MNTRDKILSAVKASQPSLQDLPVAELNAIQYEDATQQFIKVLEGIGGQVVLVNNINDVNDYLLHHFENLEEHITTIEALQSIKKLDKDVDAHLLANIQLAILPAAFAVAENGAAWLTETAMQIRALPFICQQLAIVVDKKNIVHNMQQAYDIIGTEEYGFGVFIAGPSKTADIEQSLVLGAHGPKEMIVFLLG